MSGETYIPRNFGVCMYVWGNIHTHKMIGMYVCLGKHTYPETRGMYVCMSKVCMYVWGKMSGEAYIPRKLEVSMYVKGMFVCQGKQTYLENCRYVCMPGETYIPRNYRYVCMYVCMAGETYIPRKL